MMVYEFTIKKAAEHTPMEIIDDAVRAIKVEAVYRQWEFEWVYSIDIVEPGLYKVSVYDDELSYVHR